jgi:hypothetical protein
MPRVEFASELFRDDQPEAMAKWLQDGLMRANGLESRGAPAPTTDNDWAFRLRVSRIWLIIRCQNNGPRTWMVAVQIGGFIDSFRLQRQFIALSELQRLLKSFFAIEKIEYVKWRFGIDDTPPADKDA